jgi:hypothetical protein
MKNIRILCLLLSINSLFAEARDNLRTPDARTLSMSGNGVVHTPLFNPALLALKVRNELRVDYYNRYSVDELATVSGGFCYANKILPAGLHIASFGYDEYRESLFRLSLGKRLNAHWTLGISVQYVILQSELFEVDASRLSTDIGATFSPVDNWLIAASVINLPSFSLNSESVDNKRITPYVVSLGISRQVINTLWITGGATHSEETPWDASLGMEYLPYTDFHFRAGLRTAPVRPSAGFGYRFHGLTTDVALIYHPILGISAGLGLACCF